MYLTCQLDLEVSVYFLSSFLFPLSPASYLGRYLFWVDIIQLVLRSTQKERWALAKYLPPCAVIFSEALPPFSTKGRGNRILDPHGTVLVGKRSRFHGNYLVYPDTKVSALEALIVSKARVTLWMKAKGKFGPNLSRLRFHGTSLCSSHPLFDCFQLMRRDQNCRKVKMAVFTGLSLISEMEFSTSQGYEWPSSTKFDSKPYYFLTSRLKKRFVHLAM